MRRSEAFPSQFLSKDDVAGGKILTIKNVAQQAIKGDNGDEAKPVMHFMEDDAKSWILNNTVWMTMEDAWGDDSDRWTGKRIELYVDPSIMFGNKRVGGVRCRIPDNGQTVHVPTFNSADTARREAQAAFKAANGNPPPAELAKMWKEAVLAYFGDQIDYKSLTATSWKKFLDDDFMVSENPFHGAAAESGIPESEIPF